MKKEWEKSKTSEILYSGVNFNLTNNGVVVFVRKNNVLVGDYDLMSHCDNCNYMRKNEEEFAKYCEKGFCSLENKPSESCVPNLSKLSDKHSREKPKYVNILDLYL